MTMHAATVQPYVLCSTELICSYSDFAAMVVNQVINMADRQAVSRTKSFGEPANVPSAHAIQVLDDNFEVSKVQCGHGIESNIEQNQ